MRAGSEHDSGRGFDLSGSIQPSRLPCLLIGFGDFLGPPVAMASIFHFRYHTLLQIGQSSLRAPLPDGMPNHTSPGFDHNRCCLSLVQRRTDRIDEPFVPCVKSHPRIGRYAVPTYDPTDPCHPPPRYKIQKFNLLRLHLLGRTLKAVTTVCFLHFLNSRITSPLCYQLVFTASSTF